MASKTQLKRSNPEAEGISSTAVLNFVHALEQLRPLAPHPLDAMQGFMLLRHGNVAAEGWWAPFRPQFPHQLYSLSKSFTSTAIGLAVTEGLLTVDDPVLKFFPGDAPANPSENLRAMRVRHLLSMNTGHQEDTTERVFQDLRQLSLFTMDVPHTGRQTYEGQDDNWPRIFLSLPVENEPGTWFVYNTAATYMLSAIITQLTGESLLDYLRPRLFEPLGIESPAWDTDPRGINIGGSGLHITLEDIARFGQLYLQKGVWDGQRILAEEWITEATTAASDNSNTQTNPDWCVGYGSQFWMCRHDSYRGDGAFGQFCIIMPEHDTVLAMIGGVRDMQVILDKVWEHLLPALEPQALPAAPQAFRELRAKLASLSLPVAEGQSSTPLAEQYSGQTFSLESSELQLDSIMVAFGDEQSKLIVHGGWGEHAIPIGYGEWHLGWSGISDEAVAASGAWTAADTYEIRLCYTGRVYCPIFRLHFRGSELQLEADPNVFWTDTDVRTITGHQEFS